MDNIIRCIDHAALQRAKTPQKKMSVKGLLDRKATRVPTSQERIEQNVPNRFPLDAYGPAYLREVGEFQAEHLASEQMELDKLASEMMQKSFGGSNRPSPVHGSGHSNAHKQAAPVASNHTGLTGQEVQMSG